MSILLIGIDDAVGDPLVRRLVEQDDEVRVLARDGDSGGWAQEGTHIASGEIWDADLVERAAQSVRTIVVGPEHGEDAVELTTAVVEGGALAGAGMRIVVYGPQVTRPVLAVLRATSLEYIVLHTGPRRLMSRHASLAPEAVAEAIDAADDVAGKVRLELDLTQASSWTALKLTHPAARRRGAQA